MAPRDPNAALRALLDQWNDDQAPADAEGLAPVSGRPAAAPPGPSGGVTGRLEAPPAHLATELADRQEAPAGHLAGRASHPPAGQPRSAPGQLLFVPAVDRILITGPSTALLQHAGHLSKLALEQRCRPGRVPVEAALDPLLVHARADGTATLAGVPSFGSRLACRPPLPVTADLPVAVRGTGTVTDFRPRVRRGIQVHVDGMPVFDVTVTWPAPVARVNGRPATELDAQVRGTPPDCVTRLTWSPWCLYGRRGWSWQVAR